MNCGVYSIKSPSGKQYVGSSKNLRTRWTQHKYFLSKGSHHNRHLQNAWNKYEGGLEFQTLLVCEEKDLLLYEQLVLDNYLPEYNIAKSANKAFYALGIKRSEETKNKIRVAHLGKPKKGHPISEENRKKMSESRKGSGNPMFGKIPWNKKTNVV